MIVMALFGCEDRPRFHREPDPVEMPPCTRDEFNTLLASFLHANDVLDEKIEYLDTDNHIVVITTKNCVGAKTAVIQLRIPKGMNVSCEGQFKKTEWQMDNY